MATVATSPVQALKFEILRNDDTNKDNSSSQQPVSGYITIAANDCDSSEILQKLSNEGIVDKFTLVYQNYVFSLHNTSFSVPTTKVHIDEKEITFSFHAKDVLLVRQAFG